MRNDYEEFNLNSKIGKSTGSKSLDRILEVSSAGISALIGLANWVGLGDSIARWIDKPGKGKITVDWEPIRNQLTARINKLISQNDIDLAKLESKLSSLENMGLALNGVAAHKVGQYKQQIKEQVSKKKNQNILDSNTLNRIQGDVDKLKNFTEGGNLAEYTQYGDLHNHIEKAIGEIENG